MLHLNQPHVNVLSKADLLEKYDTLSSLFFIPWKKKLLTKRLGFNLEFYTEVLDLSYLIQTINDDPLYANTKFVNLTKALSELIEDYNLVHFHTLDIQVVWLCLILAF